MPPTAAPTTAPLPLVFNGSVESAVTNGGKSVVDYRFAYRNKSIDLEAGVIVEIRAKRDVHISLSPINNVSTKSMSEHQYMYEFILGGWGNTKSAIRRTKFGVNEVTTQTNNMLTGTHPQTMWFRLCTANCIDNTGKLLLGALLEVGYGCNIGERVFMKYNDPSPITGVQYLGVATVDTGGYFVHGQTKSDMVAEGFCAINNDWQVATMAPTTTPLHYLQYIDSTPDFNCEFDYTEDSTPVIHSVSPTKGSGATRITIEGTYLAEQPTVRIGLKECTVVEHTPIATTTTTTTTVTGEAFGPGTGGNTTTPNITTTTIAPGIPDRRRRHHLGEACDVSLLDDISTNGACVRGLNYDCVGAATMKVTSGCKGDFVCNGERVRCESEWGGETQCACSSANAPAVPSWKQMHRVVCELPAVAAGRYHVRVEVPGKGYAAHPAANMNEFAFTSELVFNSIEPKQGSWSGGILVTVKGAGFSSRPSNNTVLVERGNVTKAAHVLDACATRLFLCHAVV